MSRRRRALLLGGLALVLGGLAASNVAGREAALSRRVGGLVDVVVAQRPIAAGSAIGARSLAVRRVPARFAPRQAYASPEQLEGAKAAVDVPAGTDLTPGMIGGSGRARAGPAIGRGRRVAEITALGSPQLVTPGSHVDVLVTNDARADAPGQAVLALEDVEVLAAAATGDAPSGRSQAAPGQRVAASLLVTLRQAVYLAAAQDFAHELRLLPRAAGDDGRGHAGLTMSAQP